MTTLVLGANTVITEPKCKVAFSTSTDLKFGQQIGLLCLPLDENRDAVSSPAYLHETKDWATLDNDQSPSQWHLDLPTLFDSKGAHFLQLIAYAYHTPEVNLPAVEIQSINLRLNDSITYEFQTHERHIKAAIILEIYRRNGVYKCRALGETSAQGLDSLSQRVKISIDTRHPAIHAGLQASQDEQRNYRPNDPNRPPRQVEAGETWTGTAFAIDPYHLLTCYHVIESAQKLGIRQQGEADREVQVVMSDIGSDSAVIKVSEPLPSYLTLACLHDDVLGETITTLGYPLSGINSQLQVTQGCISGLTGFDNDIRYLQFTAPIQPGSSGSPLLLPTGEVIGMVTASLAQAQNLNYAVKFQLLMALLSSAGIGTGGLTSSKSATPLSTPQISRQSRGALWMMGCQA